MDKIDEVCELVRRQIPGPNLDEYLELDGDSLEEAVADYAEGFDDDPSEPMSPQEIARAFISDCSIRNPEDPSE